MDDQGPLTPFPGGRLRKETGGLATSSVPCPAGHVNIISPVPFANLFVSQPLRPLWQT